MRLAALVLLVLAAPIAGGAQFREIDDGPTATCGEGCILLEPGERVVRIVPAEGATVSWTAEDDLGLPIEVGVVRAATMVELPAGAARVRIALL